MNRRPPLNCALCAAQLWNDETAVWGPEPHREPFCSDDCMTLANAEYVWDRAPRTPTDSALADLAYDQINDGD